MPRPLPQVPTLATSASVFLILRRMRAPLIVLILIFSISTAGLSLIPGQDASGAPRRMTLFESFYVMSYTATTIGFGEIPYAFTPAQRLWVTLSIFLSVIGWAYAIGSLLSLSRDRSFRRALAVQRFTRHVRRLQEPFLLVVGHGAAGQSLTASLDRAGRSFVVVDSDEEHVAALDLGAYRSDPPSVVGSAREPRLLGAAGLSNPRCRAVVALTGDDETNLAVAMTAALLRPDVRVVARATTRSMARRIEAFGSSEVVDPYDRFGDHLRILMRSTAAYRLMMWLTSPVGSLLPDERPPTPSGRWVVYGDGAFAEEIAHDLAAEGVDLTLVAGQGYDEHALRGADLARAVGLVAATDNDVTNLSVLETALEINPGLFTVPRQNHGGNAVLYRSIGADFTLVPAEIMLHETLARLVDPALLPFLREVPHHDQAWAEQVVDRLVRADGRRLAYLWSLGIDDAEAPALAARVTDVPVRVGELIATVSDPAAPGLVALAILRDGAPALLVPDAEVELAQGDRVLWYSSWATREALRDLCRDPDRLAARLTGRRTADGWLWRTLAR